MKYLKFVVVVFVLYFLGYVLGPSLAPMLVKERQGKEEAAVLVKYKGAQYSIKLAEYEDDELPETLKIENRTRIPTAGGAGEILLSKGDTVTLLSRSDEGLTVETADAQGKGTVNPADTDLFAQLAKQVYDTEAAKSGGEDQIAKIPSVPASPTEKAASATPSPKSATEPTPGSVTEIVPTAEPESAPEPEPAPVAKAELSAAEIEALMRESIQGGALEEFTFDQVKGWKATESETVDGTEYQTGLAAYEAKTIFGVRAVQAKALIKDGKIERWVYAKSGMEIQ